MPEIKLSHVVSFSSEDASAKADNLLSTSGSKKWKCKEKGEKQATVELQLEKASVISNADVGNNGSAFIEIRVGRSQDAGSGSGEYKTLLAATSFMSPIESRNEDNMSRVRMFSKINFNKEIAGEKWDRVQIVCTQPFNKQMRYGLSFITLKSPEEAGSSAAKPKESTGMRLGAFKLKNEDEIDGRKFSLWMT